MKYKEKKGWNLEKKMLETSGIQKILKKRL